MTINELFMIYFRCPDVLWNPIGIDGEESLLIKEGEESEMFIISGTLGSAIWSRLDGTRTVNYIALEMADHVEVSRDDALDTVNTFMASLEENQLIQKEQVKSPSTDSSIIIDWPEIMETPTLSPFDLQTLVSEDMVALASFAGGQSNTGGVGSCQVGPGGRNNNTGIQPVCHP
jgi:Coenzyme PQQ synthesis protein D (PqqD)